MFCAKVLGVITVVHLVHMERNKFVARKQMNVHAKIILDYARLITCAAPCHIPFCVKVGTMQCFAVPKNQRWLGCVL